MVSEDYLMSSIKEILISQLARFDDEAFAALANRGLLRRAQKDLEKISATIIDITDKTLVIGFADYKITFDERGPSHATCSCKSGGICQHILSASLALQKNCIENGLTVSGDKSLCVEKSTDVIPPEDKQPISSDGQDLIDDLHTALLNITTEELITYCGKAGYRWAWQYVQDIDCDHDLHISGGKYIIIRLSHPQISLRYLGGGLDNLICDTPNSKLKQLRIAAILAYHKVNGKEIIAPESNKKSAIIELNLGKDFTSYVSQETANEESRDCLRKVALQIFPECIQLGLSHLTSGFHERFSTLALWSQGAKYYRLGLFFRRLADHVELLLDRSANADEQRLFDELTIAHALVSALEEASKKHSEPVYLIGKARNCYESSGTKEVFGLGAHAWRSPSGYVGLTMIFWSPQDASFLSYTDARPEIALRGFNPVNRYKASGPWNGLSSPSAATGHRVILSGAATSEVGRISGSENVTATIESCFSRTEIVSQYQIHTLWNDLFYGNKKLRRSLLSEPDPMKDWVILQPKRFGKSKFDAIRQTLIWPLFDTTDQRIDAELVYYNLSIHAISRIENLEPSKIKTGTLLVARIRPGSFGQVVEPLSLINATDSENENAIDCLHFDKDITSPNSKWFSKIQNFVNGESKDPIDSNKRILMPSALEELGRFLRNKAERGVSTETENEFDRDFHLHCEKTTAVGLTAFENLCNNNSRAAVQLLQANYIRLQYERLFDETQV